MTPEQGRALASAIIRACETIEGSPVNGSVVVMVFATSLDDPDTMYALTMREISPVVRLASSSAVSTGTCVAG